MEIAPIHSVRGRAVPAPGDDVDTDQIIPARFMKCVDFEGLGAHLFSDVRAFAREAGGVHPLDDPRRSGASILFAGANFGCGSSREHAPQALYRHGIRAVIAASFAEIFFGNCAAIGLPCAAAAPADLVNLSAAIAADPGIEITLDIEGRTIAWDGEAPGSISAEIPDAIRDAFLSGRWDPIAELLDGRPAADALADRLPAAPAPA